MSILQDIDKITVWVADGSATPSLDYGTRLYEHLAEIGVPTQRRDFTTVSGDEYLDSGLHVMSGGETSVNDMSTWMPGAKKLVKRMIQHAEEGSSRLLGVCLGSQLIADSLAPGAIISGPVITAGLVEVAWVGSDSADDLAVLPAFHFEQIDKGAAQKAGIKIVASCATTPTLAYRYGTRIGGIQLHPEWSVADTSEVMQHNPDVVTTYGGDLQQVAQESERLAPRLSSAALHLVVDKLLG